MDKLLQKAINDEVIYRFNSAMDEFRKEGYLWSEKLRSCSAMVYATSNWYILKSYDTFIACIYRNTNVCYDALRHEYYDVIRDRYYSATSAQHVSKFWHDYCFDWRADKCSVLTYRNI